MFCPKCGAQAADGAQFCASCGQAIAGGLPPQPAPAAPPGAQFMPPQAAGPTVENYMLPAVLITILSVLCCCNPLGLAFGIVAIVFASQVTNKLQMNDYQGAAESSKKAKTWCWVAVIVTIITWIIFVLITFITGSLGALMQSAGMQ